MDNAARIAHLRREAMKSIDAAIAASQAWQIRNNLLKQQYGAGTPEYRIAKRDDLYLKDKMAEYVWHRDNSSWANAMIGMLQGEVVDASRIPVPR